MHRDWGEALAALARSRCLEALLNLVVHTQIFVVMIIVTSTTSPTNPIVDGFLRSGRGSARCSITLGVVTVNVTLGACTVIVIASPIVYARMDTSDIEYVGVERILFCVITHTHTHTLCDCALFISPLVSSCFLLALHFFTHLLCPPPSPRAFRGRVAPGSPGSLLGT